jgi:hypothetical protein
MERKTHWRENSQLDQAHNLDPGYLENTWKVSKEDPGEGRKGYIFLPEALMSTSKKRHHLIWSTAP